MFDESAESCRAAGGKLSNSTVQYDNEVCIMSGLQNRIRQAVHYHSRWGSSWWRVKQLDGGCASDVRTLVTNYTNDQWLTVELCCVCYIDWRRAVLGIKRL